MAFHAPRISTIAAVALLGFTLSSAQAGAAKTPNVGKPVAVTADSAAAAVETVAVADRLMRWGYVNKDPLALITAAKLKKSVGESPSKAQRVSGKAGEAKSKTEGLSIDLALARAKDLAGGRADLQGLADDVAKSNARGNVNGPGTSRTVVRANSVDSFRVTFVGGEPARVLVSGDGDTDLDLYVYDQNGNRVCADDDSTDTMLCGWTPRYTGPFTIRVRNLGNDANLYTIVTN